jgi:4'-phosphopantetheinyl transferase
MPLVPAPTPWTPPPHPLTLPPNQIHVWRLSHNPQCLPPAAWESTLSPEELARAHRFSFHRDRNAYITTRSALRDLLGQYLSNPPSEIRISYADRGKPHLDPATSPLQFNVSHTRGLALLAFAMNRRLGIDVEKIRPIDNWQDIARRYFSQKEIAELAALPPAQRDEGFYTCWTRKESYVKASGEGLLVPLDSFDVTLTPGAPEILTAADASKWTLRSIDPHPGYVAALTVEGQNFDLNFWDYSPTVTTT